MPYKANEPRRHKIPRARYRVEDWQRAVRYGRRSLGEVAMMRYKQVISRSLRARTLRMQKVEAAVGCKSLNIMAALGMPVSRKGA